MSYESVRDDLARRAPDLSIVEAEQSTATVIEAAAALGVTPGQIAKTLALHINDRVVLLVARGDARLDNQKAKAALGGKPRMLDAEQTLAATGHPVGGVSPFGLPGPLPVYCDVSLRAFATVFPAAGSRNSSVEVATDRLAMLLGAEWVDVCSLPAGG
jgi:prolyl-tRNA editing enzyme YbaK/EbsC (Cys-tRNA(Pro) deacylase)